MKNNSIVFTTIYTPHVLRDLLENLQQYNHLESTICWVVGDNKTPKACQDLCKEISDSGLETIFLDIPTQDKWGDKYPDFYKLIPYNNESRRNIGYLRALEQGCTRLISMDDDNFPTSDDLIGGHQITGKKWKGSLIHENSGYHNVCEYLEIHPSRDIYPRGFPFGLRGAKNENMNSDAPLNAIIGINEGLWLKEPDIDATTWLNGRVEAKKYTGPDYFALDQNTWSPINTQNTSVIRDLIPAYLCIPMAHPVPGGKIERYGDIWGGYFTQAVMRGTQYHVAFGRPIVEHRRNPHKYVDDLRHEFWGMVLTDWLLDNLRNNFYPESTEISERVKELSAFIREQSHKSLPDWCPTEVKKFFERTSKNLYVWSDVCQNVS